MNQVAQWHIVWTPVPADAWPYKCAFVLRYKCCYRDLSTLSGTVLNAGTVWIFVKIFSFFSFFCQYWMLTESSNQQLQRTVIGVSWVYVQDPEWFLVLELKHKINSVTMYNAVAEQSKMCPYLKVSDWAAHRQKQTFSGPQRQQMWMCPPMINSVCCLSEAFSSVVSFLNKCTSVAPCKASRNLSCLKWYN